MLRRDFLKLMTGLGVMVYSSSASAQSFDKAKLKALSDKLSNLWEQNSELDTINEEQLFFPDVISFDQSCTLSDAAISLTFYPQPSQDNP